MNFHEMSTDHNINYQKSGFLLVGIAGAIPTDLFIRGKHQPYLALGTAVLAVFALFEVWPLRKAIVLFIGFGDGMHRVTNQLVFSLQCFVTVISTSLVLKLISLHNCCSASLTNIGKRSMVSLFSPQRVDRNSFLPEFAS